MNKVYLIQLFFSDGWGQETRTRVAKTFEKAKEILKYWAEYEIENSWIGDYDKDDYADYQFDDEYFHALYGEFTTRIWIEEKDVEQ